jgi:hypothetical protein
MGRAIFISYRRDDTEGEAGRLFDDLTRTFGGKSVFMDVTDIKPGLDFRKVIDDNVATCGVLLAMIGPAWTTIANSSGERRLDDPNDFVRLEIASALARDIAVIPVLVHDAKMPHPDQLPDNLKDLAFRNSVELTHTRWNSDVQLLNDALAQYVDASSKPSDEPVHATVSVQLPPANPSSHEADAAKPSKKPLLVGIAIGASLILVAVIVLVVVLSGGSSTGNDSSNTSVTQKTTLSSELTEKTSTSNTTESTISTDNPLEGTWTNSSDVGHNGLDRLEIAASGDQLSIHAWGMCEPKDCDWGVQTATLQNQQAQASWSFQKEAGQEADRVATVTLKPESSGLSVHIENTYPDHPATQKQFNFVRAQ